MPGNTPPVIKLRRPYIGSVVTYGVPTSYKLYVYDKEDGNSGAGTIKCSSVTCTPGLGHNDHVHDAIPVKGCNGTLIPAREDTVGEFFAILRVQYTDKGRYQTPALTSTLTVRFQPSLYEAENYDQMYGVQTETTSDPAGGYQDVGWIDDGDWVMYKGWNLQGIDNVTLRVASAQSANGLVTIRMNSPTGRAIGSAHIPITGGWQSFIDVTAPISDTNQFFEVDLGATKQVTKLVMNSGASQYPRGYDIYVSENPDPSSLRYYPINWIVSGNGTSNDITVTFPANTKARFIKIVQTAKCNAYWTINVSKETQFYMMNWR